jgi:type II secretory ATPase GspE/PulE/Tfp pilus assembly ATPase PilB-like protein
MPEADEWILTALLSRGWRPLGGVDLLRAEAARLRPNGASAEGDALRRWVDEGKVDPGWAAEALAAHFGLKSVKPGEDVPTDHVPIVAALSPLERRTLIASRVFPLRRVVDSVELAIENPLNEAVLTQIGSVLGAVVVPVVAPDEWIRRAWQGVDVRAGGVSGGGVVQAGIAAWGHEQAAHAENGVMAVHEDAPIRSIEAPAARQTSVNLPAPVSIAAMVDTLFENAIGSRASDIHLEPSETRIRVRHRIDGVLRDAGEVHSDHAAAVMARTKLLAGMSIVERRLPQDGRFRWSLRRATRDFRVSSVPTIRGESVVIRILDDAAGSNGSVDSLANVFSGAARERWERLIHATDGLVLVTGPTGSGKSSTLHASLSRLAQTGRKVITIEDPVERELPRVVQVGVRADLGLGFPEALRAVLRQSPEVIAVGEVRDRETARSCLNASLTGHLVFSTVHTADAVGAIVRLRDLGLPPSLLASALRGVVAQRLVRRVCRSCADAPTTVFAAESCAACCGTGFSGRVAVVELLVVDDALRALIRRDAGADALRTAARAAGMRTLAEDGRARVQDGLTTADELSRVLGPTLS